ncbi:MAG: PQQ-binding-like beta-propeller repeat protein [Alphaproteobacteria bacterium]|nr:PQQ-binding-like beta-propeller repeat protein [Alphaproteobacteria bacterium]
MSDYEQLPEEPYPMFSTPDVSRVQAHPGRGLFLAVVGDTLTFRKLDDGSEHAEEIYVRERVLGSHLSPDGRRVVVGTCENVAIVFDIDSGEELARTPKFKDYLDNVRWLDDDRFVGVSQQIEMSVFDGRSGQPLKPILTDAIYDSLFGVEVSHDGGRIFLAHGERIRCFDVGSGAVVWERSFDWSPQNPTLSPDGQRLLFCAGGLRTLRAADGADVAQGPHFPSEGIQYPGQIGMGTSWDTKPSWSADARRVAVNLPNGQFAIYEAETLTPVHTFDRTDALAWIESVHWLPDSDRILMGTSHNHVLLFSAASGKVIEDWEGADADSYEGGDSGGPSPVLAGVLSFFFPGLGQLMCGQTLKGVVLFALTLITCGLGGLLNLVAAIDAWRIASRLDNDEEVGDWQFF